MNHSDHLALIESFGIQGSGRKRHDGLNDENVVRTTRILSDKKVNSFVERLICGVVGKEGSSVIVGKFEY